MGKIFASMRYWLTQIFLFLLLISPSIIITFYSYTQLKGQLTQQLFVERQSLAKQMAVLVESRLEAMSDVGLTNADAIVPYAEKGDWKTAVKELEHVSKEFPYVDRIFIADTKGTAVALYPPSPENIGKDFSYRDWYKGVSKHWEPYVSEVFKRAPYPQFNTVAVASPIKKADGTPLGVVGFAVNLDSFYELSNKFSVEQGGFLYIINHKGQIIAHPNYPSQGKIIDFSRDPVVQKLLKGKSGIEETYNPMDKESFLAAFQVVPKYHWGVVIEDPLTIAFSARNNILKNTLAIDTLLIVLNGILAIFLLGFFEKTKKSKETLQAVYQELKVKESQLNEAQQAGQVGTFTLNLQDNSILISDEMYRLYGIDPQEGATNTKDFFSLIYPEDLPVVQQKIAEGSKTKNPFEVVYRTKYPKGDMHWLKARARTIFSHNKQAVQIVGTIHDITKERELEQMKDEFLSVASHELRTPMTAIKGLSSMVMEGEFGKVNENLKVPLNDIYTSTDRLINLVNDLLSVSRIQAGRVVLSLTDTPLNSFVTQIITTLQPLTKKKGLTFKSNDLPDIAVQTDLDKAQQIITNVIGNAVKFTDTGGITISAQVMHEKDLVKLLITDTGIGISPENQTKLFQKFQQVTSETKGRPAGTGLGLFISKELAQRMGGDLWIEKSDVGKGTTFAFSLPLAKSSKAVTIKKELEKDSNSESQTK